MSATDYRPEIDGLRAIAVTAVVLYHASAGLLPGGFIGVDVFFVISGYLITSILAQEWRNTGRIDLPAFYARRVRRLLPALGVVLVATVAVAAVVLPRLSSAWIALTTCASVRGTSRLPNTATPSRDSHELRHCEKARHARSGRPRCAARSERSGPRRSSRCPTPTPIRRSWDRWDNGGLKNQNRRRKHETQDLADVCRGGGDRRDGAGVGGFAATLRPVNQPAFAVALG